MTNLDALVDRVIAEVRPYTMVPDEGLRATIILTLQTIASDVPGDLVECGTWLGGSSFAMLLAQRYAFGEIRRPVWMYDSFQGMGEPSDADGGNARRWKDYQLSGVPDRDGWDYCVAPLHKVMQAVTHFGLNHIDEVRLVPGWLEKTLPKHKPEQIAVLRVDCDWYDPVKLVLDQLEPLVPDYGVIILDDYCAWAGCVLATHEHLAKNRLAWPIHSLPNDAGAWLFKNNTPKESNV
jgi:hypothetical protein